MGQYSLKYNFYLGITTGLLLSTGHFCSLSFYHSSKSVPLNLFGGLLCFY